MNFIAASLPGARDRGHPPMPLLIALAAVAFLYASLGHAGDSGYIALPAVLLRQRIGVVLLLSAWKLLAT
ncbi:hypothetical protein KBZ12_12230 [Cyanobium sp. Cruz CV13-4-11]|uniref:hypothetical protein n=1 Tax=unclassified Cyanobium TaxID=2627006 RepID=UPI0020CD69B6|nr:MULTISPECIES: hypothetical protein [unclassified Cyanobium]MCP9920231.1 hypothetical protein [Cyanobium sp. Cruz CV13-4-11]